VFPICRYISHPIYAIYRRVCPLLAALFPAPSGRRGGRVKHMWHICPFGWTSHQHSGPKLAKWRGLPHNGLAINTLNGPHRTTTAVVWYLVLLHTLLLYLTSRIMPHDIISYECLICCARCKIGLYTAVLQQYYNSITAVVVPVVQVSIPMIQVSLILPHYTE